MISKRFDLSALAGKAEVGDAAEEARQLIKDVQETSKSSLWTTVNFIRLVCLQLLAVAVLAALVAIRADSQRASLSCALAATVCFVAAAHYYLILKKRSDSNFEKPDNEAVDVIRLTDWAITLPLMVLHLHDLADKAVSGSKKPPLIEDQFEGAVAAFGVIALGAIAWAIPGNKGGVLLVRIFVFIGSCALCGVLVASIFGTVHDADYGGNRYRWYEGVAVEILVGSWIAYPVIVFATELMALSTGWEMAGAILRDVGLGFADVFAKGGMATFAVFSHQFAR